VWKEQSEARCCARDRAELAPHRPRRADARWSSTLERGTERRRTGRARVGARRCCGWGRRDRARAAEQRVTDALQRQLAVRRDLRRRRSGCRRSRRSRPLPFARATVPVRLELDPRSLAGASPPTKARSRGWAGAHGGRPRRAADRGGRAAGGKRRRGASGNPQIAAFVLSLPPTSRPHALETVRAAMQAAGATGRPAKGDAGRRRGLRGVSIAVQGVRERGRRVRGDLAWRARRGAGPSRVARRTLAGAGGACRARDAGARAHSAPLGTADGLTGPRGRAGRRGRATRTVLGPTRARSNARG
jgi:hypothetical protein